MPLAPGSCFGPYEIVAPIGAGGMGEVYKAQDTRLKRFVAIKVLAGTEGGAEYRRRFIQEGRAASALNHPNIITIYDVVSQDGLDLMVMEFVAGQTLDSLIPKGGMPAASVLNCAVQMADALSVAHSAGIVHRDLKPGNVMVTSSGLVKILDFGLAKVTNPVSETAQTLDTLPLSLAMTVEGSIVGTVSYMSPEQAEGRRVDARSDIFSFGLTVYEMLTGERAFLDGSVISTLSKILRDEAKPISAIVKGVPLEFEQIINRALRKDPAQRWQSMDEMHAALVALRQRLESATIVRQESAGKKLPVTPIAAGVLVAAALGAGGWWWTHRDAAPAVAPKAAPTAETVASAPAPAPAANSALTNQSIIDMLQAKVPESAILGQVRSSATKFDLTPAELIRLTKAGATAELLDAMRNPQSPAPVAKQAAEDSAPATPAEASTHPLTVGGGLPMSIALAEDVPASPAAGEALHFRVAENFIVGGSVVVAKGAAVDGEIFGKRGRRFPIVGRSKPTFRVFTVTAADGSKLAIRAARTDRLDAPLDKPIAGSSYTVYVDGEQTVKGR